MGSDMRLDSLSSWEREAAPQAEGAPQGQGANAALGRVAPHGNTQHWVDALPFLVILLLLLLSPILYDLFRWLRTR